MILGTDARQFRSPATKLVRFFQGSRDSWKRKHQEAKRLCKKLGNQVRAVEKSRAHWKKVAGQQRQRVRELERQLADSKRAGIC